MYVYIHVCTYVHGCLHNTFYFRQWLQVKTKQVLKMVDITLNVSVLIMILTTSY